MAEKDKTEEFSKNYQKLVSYKKIFGHCYVPLNWRTDPVLAKWSSRISEDPAILNKEQKALLDKIGFDFSGYIVKTEKDVQWKRMYERLKRYVQKVGNAKVPSSYTEDKSLSKWVSRQRALKGHMGKERKQLLNAVGFLWKEDIESLKQYKWLAKFQELKSYKETYDTLTVTSKSEEYKSLRIWVDDQRKRGKLLKAFQKNKLKSIDFPFSEDIQKGYAASWESKYQQLKEFYKEFGHSKVPSKWKENTALAQWVQKQRTFRYKLTAEQKQKLYRLGFSWKEDIAKDKVQRWEKMYGDLKQFYKRFGHSRVPESWKENRPLGDWVYLLRRNKEKLSKERIAKLNELHFVWKIDLSGDRERLWLKRYNELYEFYERFGHSKVPEGWKENKALAIWVAVQRSKKNELSKYRVDKLHKIKFLWKEDLKDLKRSHWDKMYGELKEYFKEKGHSNVPSTYKQNPKLAGWVVNLRKKAKLTKAQIKQLDKLDFVWIKDKSFDDQIWDKRYDELKEFYEEYGHSRVPDQWKENEKLANWVAHQRGRKKRGIISDVQVAKLNKVKFAWKIK